MVFIWGYTKKEIEHKSALFYFLYCIVYIYNYSLLNLAKRTNPDVNIP